MRPRVEVWTDLACRSGQALLALPWLTLRVESVIEDVVALDRVVLTCPASSEIRSALVPGRVLVVQGTTALETRIVEVQEATDDATLTVRADDLLLDLACRDQMVFQRVGGRVVWSPAVAPATPSTLLSTWVLAYAPSWMALGTVTPTTVSAPSSVAGTPLAAARAITAAARLTSGLPVVLRLRRNGTTDYRLDLIEVGASAPVVQARTGLNLQRALRTLSRSGQITRAVALGQDGRGLGDNWWTITAVSTNSYVEIADPTGRGALPIVEDGALTGLSARVHDAATLYPITGTTAASNRLSMNPTPASPVGKWLTIVTSAGEEVPWLDAPTAQANWGIVLGTVSRTLPGRTNWIINGDLADWTGARPAGWGGTGTAPTKVTSAGDWETGGQSARYTDIAFASLSYTGRSVRCAAGTVITVGARVRVDNPAGGQYLRVMNPLTSLSEDIPFDSTFPDVGVWVYVTRQYYVTTAGSYSVGVVALHSDGTGTVLLDHAVAFVGGSDLPTGYVAGSGGATLWGAAVQALRTQGETTVRLEVRMADLQPPDSETPSPQQSLVLGGAIRLVDAERGWTVVTRVVRLLRHWETGLVDLEVAVRADALTGFITGER